MMNSSESEEDFESADEDFDLDNPSNHKEKDEEFKHDINNENDNKENSSLDASPREVLDKLKKVSIEEKLVTKNDESLAKDKVTSDGLQKQLEVDSPKIEEKNNKSLAKSEATSGRSQKPLEIHTTKDEEKNITVEKGEATSGRLQKPLEVDTTKDEEKNITVAKGEATSGRLQKPLEVDTTKDEEKNFSIGEDETTSDRSQNPLEVGSAKNKENNFTVAIGGATSGISQKPLEVDTPKNEELKIKPTIKKLGTKLTTNEPKIVGPKNDSSYSRPENKNGKNKGEINLQPMKLGMKLTSDIQTGKGNENSVQTSLESAKSTNEENVDTFLTNTPKSVETNFEAGDGWEFEEEDGFEIPVTLAKTGDDGIKCAQEQISELDQVEFKPSKAEQEQGWGEWGGWGVSSLLSTATGTMTTFSSHVTAGLSTVLDTTVGPPVPEMLAVEQASPHENKEEPIEREEQTNPGYVGFGSIVSGVSFLGSSMISRGLDTLETIGKKTMEVLQEGDPGLKKKRAMLFQNQDKPVLSQILREAKEKADNSDKEKEEKEAARKVHFESLFDDYQGMVHLEALEMLSTQCELKLQSLLQSHAGAQLLDLQETLSQVRDLCELSEEEEEAEVLTAEQFAEKITICIEGLRINISPAKIIKVNSEICERLEQLRLESATVVNQTAISSLAELTAVAMECFHKSAELILAKSIHNTANEADSYVQLTNHLCARISAVANEFTQLLTRSDPINNSSLITNIFLEASNSCSYIKNACQLLVPILQVGTVAS